MSKRGSREVRKQEGKERDSRVCGVVKARVTSHQRLRVRIPSAAKAAVAQLAEQWQTLGPFVPAARMCAVAKAGVPSETEKRAFLRSALKTSGHQFPAQGFRCGEGARYFRQRALGRKPERTAGNGTPPISREIEAQTNSRGPIVPTGKKMHGQEWLCYREAGMAQRRVTSSVTRRGADAPQLCSIFLPAKVWPARIADQSAVRAGAGA